MVKAGNNDFAITNEKGEYNLYLGQDTFSITTSASIRYHHTVPSQYSVGFTGFDQLITGRDFAIQPIPGINDLAIDITPLTPRARPGFRAQYQVSYKNNGTTTPTGYYTVKLPPEFNFDTADNMPVYNANDSLRFDFVALQPFQTRVNVITGTINSTTPLQTMLLYRAHIYPDNEDSSASDNIDSILHRVSGSYDPNSKDVYPSTAMPIDSIVAGRQSYEYTLNFQNTGTDTAFTVIVRDTLSSKLDIETFELVSYSHPLLFALKSGRALEFRFNNILLPDSNTNEPRSHGFVKFRIKPFTGLSLSDTIYNNCSIYFDYNEPVKTNTTSIAFKKDVATGINDPDDISSSLQLFPNPARESIFYELKRNFTGNYGLKIYDLNGRLLYSQSKNGFQVKGSLRTDFLSRGMYIFEFVSRKTIARKKFLKL
jgi:hypothetical protein